MVRTVHWFHKDGSHTYTNARAHMYKHPLPHTHTHTQHYTTAQTRTRTTEIRSPLALNLKGLTVCASLLSRTLCFPLDVVSTILLPYQAIHLHFILIIITIIIIAFKGASRDFFAISSQRREPSPTRTLEWPRRNRVQITCNTSSACHVQHVVLRVTWYEGTAQLLSLTRVEIAFI